MKTTSTSKSIASTIFISITLLLGLIGLPEAALSQQRYGQVKESLIIESNILDKEVEYSIYLPPDYEESNRSYPVLYLLHGFTDDETGWTQFGEIKNIMDSQVHQTAVTPMIVVMPDAGLTWYVNNHDGSVRYEDFFINEFIPKIEETYRIRPQKQFRAISGLSMGGYGTMIMALKHPDLFSAAAPLSAGISTQESIVSMSMDNWNNVYGLPFGKDREGKERLTDHYLANSVLDIIKTGDTEKFKTMGYYIDCGDDDFLIRGNMALHEVMLDQQIPHEFRVRDGAHNWTYWRTALPEVFQFVSEKFHR